MIRILLVDDERFSLKGMESMIPWEKWDCKIVATADTAQKAIEIVQSEKIDIIFTDIKMPEMDGLQMIRAIKKFKEDMVFVILSGYGEFEYAQKAIALGVKNYLLKPVSISEVEETLLNLSEQFRTKRHPELFSYSGQEITVAYGSIIDEIVLAISQKNWNKIQRILLDMFKSINEQGGNLGSNRKAAITLLSTLINKEIIFYNQSTLLLAGEIGSATSQSEMYAILKDQILLTQNQIPDAIKEQMNPHIQKILIYLLTHYVDTNITLKWLSQSVVFVNPDYLGKLFLQETGKSFALYLAEFRIARSCEYLKHNPRIQIGELAAKVGYEDNVSYFIRQFKKIVGTTPAEYASSCVVE